MVRRNWQEKNLNLSKRFGMVSCTSTPKLYWARLVKVIYKFSPMTIYTFVYEKVTILIV